RPSPFRENQVCVEWREARLSVRPGITGLWQVCRSNRDSSDFHQWISYDIAYVRHMSPLLDLRIIIATILTLGGRKAVSLDRIIPGYHDQFVTPPRLVDVPILTTWPDVREAACR
ncbi:MAG: sugar transferase, partial [Phycisphaerales bacterium]|nr:sugar transferase [Phycisphaerales bacterium]